MERIKNIKIPARAGFIDYRDMRLPKIIDGKWCLDGTYMKDNRFSNQSEYRIELFIHSDKPYVLEVGDIYEIYLLS